MSLFSASTTQLNFSAVGLQAAATRGCRNSMADTPVYRFILAITLSLSVNSDFLDKNNKIAWIMEMLQHQSTPFQRTEKEKGKKDHTKILTPGCASWSAFPHSLGVASLPHSSTEPPRPHSLWDSAREGEKEKEDEEKNGEENEDKGEEEAFNHLLSYWFHRDWE